MVDDKAFEIMEKDLLPVFAEAVKLCKKISNNQDYFKNYKAARKLYAMALVSKAIKSVNNGVVSEEQKRENVSRLELLSHSRFYLPNGELGEKEVAFNRPEVVEFKENMRNFGANYFEDAYIQECLGSLEHDCAISMWNGEKQLLNIDGKVLDWKKAKDLSVFKFATSQIKQEMFIDLMNKRSKENKWDKKDWNNNYPLVNKECEKVIELKFAQYCLEKTEAKNLIHDINKEL